MDAESVQLLRDVRPLGEQSYLLRETIRLQLCAKVRYPLLQLDLQLMSD